MYRINHVRKALDYAIIKHDGQFRKGTGQPYVSHPIKVAFMLQSMNLPYATVMAGLLHDTLEDTSATYEELVEEFGVEVADLVVELTTDPIECSRMGKNNYLIQKMINMSKDAFCAKLGDRFDNISDNPTEKYLLDTRVMISELKEKRENISLEARDLMEMISYTIDKKLKKEN